MDQARIEFLVKNNPYIESSDYLESIVSLLRVPKWYEFRRRRSFKQRVRIIMAEYAKELIREIQSQPQTQVRPVAQRNSQASPQAS